MDTTTLTITLDPNDKLSFPPVKRAPRHRCMLPNHWVHVSARTQQGRFAFVPVDKVFTARAWGIIGRGMRRYCVKVAGFVLPSNHFHVLCKARRPSAIGSFIQYVKAGLARLTHEYHGTSGTVWDGPYRATTLLDDEAETYWFRYIISHLTKDGALPAPGLWPGPNCIAALTEGERIVGLWFEREEWHKDGCPEDRTPYLTKVPITLTPITRFEGRTSDYRAWCVRMVDDIIAENADRHFQGLPAALAIPATHIPETTKKSRCPCFSAHGESRKELREEAYKARAQGITAVMEALRRLVLSGNRILTDYDNYRHPDGVDWPVLINDVLDTRPIVGPFMPPEGEPPGPAVE